MKRKSLQSMGFVMSLFLSVLLTYVLIENRELIQNYQGSSYLAVFVLSLITHLTIIFPGPTYAIAITMGAILHPVWVGILMGLGACIGESLGYWMGRWGLGLVLSGYPKFFSRIKKYGTWAIFFLALFPNPLFDIGAIMAGMIRLPFWRFLSATFVGKSLRFIVMAALGKGILEWINLSFS